MRKISLIIMLIISVFLVSCSNMKIGFEKDSIFYNGGVVYIYLNDESNTTDKYRVYINGEDTEISLTNHVKTRFGVQEGKTTIEIKKGKKIAIINLFLSKATNYYLKVTKNKNNAIKITQVQQNDINANIKETPLYTDDNTQKKSSVNENTKTPDNGNTIFYYNAEDGE